MTVSDYQVTEQMSLYGETFVKKLAELYILADEFNRARLRGAFPEHWDKYREQAERVELLKQANK